MGNDLALDPVDNWFSRQQEAPVGPAGATANWLGRGALALGQEFYQQGQGLVQSLALPGAVFRGEAQPSVENSAQFGLAAAGMGTPAGALTREVGSTLGTFGGRMARTEDIGAGGALTGEYNGEARPYLMGETASLRHADRLDTAGASPEDIWRDTGWMKSNYDGKWRWEISDLGSSLRPDNLHHFGLGEDTADWNSVSPDHKVGVPSPTRQYPTNGPSYVSQTKLEDVLDHPDLYRAYPELRDMPVQPMPSATWAQHAVGAFDPAQGTLFMRPAEPESFHSTLLHEVQHAIQHIEGFDTGASPEGLLSQSDLDKVQRHEQQLQLTRDLMGERGTVSQQFLQSISKDNPGFQRSISKNGIAWSPESLASAYRRSAAGQSMSSLDMARLDAALEAMIDPAHVQITLDNATAAKQLRQTAHDAYSLVSGEAEARNVQRRWEGSHSTSFPGDTLDVPGGELIRPGTVLGQNLSVTPIDHDPFGLVPVPHDPFSQTLAPVEHDPFAGPVP